jgi:HK97 family phage portal protein
MALIDRLLKPFHQPPGAPPTNLGAPREPDRRAFVLGPAVVDPVDRYWGHPTDAYAPADYGAYVATSSTIYAAVRLRADLLSSLPLKLYSGGGTERQKEVTTGPERDLLDHVNPLWTRRRLVEMTSMATDLWGVAYWFVEKSARGIPRQLWWARPDNVRVIPDEKTYVAGFVYQPPNGARPIAFRPDETLWLRRPNPVDEFAGLSPLAAARLAADTTRDAMISNRNLFTNGINPGGFVSPATGEAPFSKEQRDELREQLNRHHKGVDNAHRWGVFQRPFAVAQTAITPHDAEFVALLQWSLEDVARCYGIPLDLLGGQRTYANVDASERIVWTQTIRSHANFIASEITEQLLPMFGPGGVDLAEFDLSGVVSLQEDETQKWTRAKDAFLSSGLKLNDYRKILGLDPIAGILGDAILLPRGAAFVDEDGDVIATASGVGDVSALGAPASGVPTLGSPQPAPAPAAIAPPAKAPAAAKPEDGAAEQGATGAPRVVAYDSPEHRALWRQHRRRREPWERRLAETVADLMRRQRQSVVTRLRDAERSEARGEAETTLGIVFSSQAWKREFRTAVRPVLAEIAAESGTAALDALAVGGALDKNDPHVVAAIEPAVQRFADEGVAATRAALAASLAAGFAADERMPALVARAEEVLNERIRATVEAVPPLVAAVAVLGQVLAWRQSGRVARAVWLAPPDGDPTPVGTPAGVPGDGHGRIGGLDEWTDGTGLLLPVLDVDDAPAQNGNGNGYALADLARLVGVKGA